MHARARFGARTLSTSLPQPWVWGVLSIPSLGVRGGTDHHTPSAPPLPSPRRYEEVCVLRAVETSDYMTAGWYKMPYDLLAKISSRIINEVKGINRVTYDISTKPPATIEWL